MADDCTAADVLAPAVEPALLSESPDEAAALSGACEPLVLPEPAAVGELLAALEVAVVPRMPGISAWPSDLPPEPPVAAPPLAAALELPGLAAGALLMVGTELPGVAKGWGADADRGAVVVVRPPAPGELRAGELTAGELGPAELGPAELAVAELAAAELAAGDDMVGAGEAVGPGEVAGAGAGEVAEARGDGEVDGAASLGEVALAAGRVLPWARLAGWDRVAPCGWDLGLADADGAALDVAEASYRYRLYWRIRPTRLVP